MLTYHAKVSIFFKFSIVFQNILKTPETHQICSKKQPKQIFKNPFSVKNLSNMFFNLKNRKPFSRTIPKWTPRLLIPLYLFLKFSWELNNARDIELCNLGENKTMHKYFKHILQVWNLKFLKCWLTSLWIKRMTGWSKILKGKDHLRTKKNLPDAYA